MRENGSFDFKTAFSRNLGLVTPEELLKLRKSRVAIAGLGGVGGMHAITLTRMGIGKFNIADFDHFELSNFNRQIGATVSTIGREKCKVIAEMVEEINPSAEIKSFTEGISQKNISEFVDGVDVVVDGLDFFAVETREVLYREAYNAGVPVVGAGPIGLGMIVLMFLPGAMSWDEYFSMDLAKSERDKYLLFALGNAPKGLHLPYMIPEYIKLDKKMGPSSAVGVQLSSGVIGAEVLKLILSRGPLYPAPYYQQFDSYFCRHYRGKLRWGNRGLLQRLKFLLLRKRYMSANPKSST